MKLVIGNSTYSALDNLKFSPQTDLTADHLPINEFEVRLFTNDLIAYGQYAELRDDLDNLWARYWISYAERIGQDVDRGTYIVRLIAQSSLAFLERMKLPAKMYNTTAANVLSDILTTIGQSGAITLDSDVATDWSNMTINGFCPEQTARERLQWLLLCAGGYIKSFFDNGIKISKVDVSGGELIPLEKTFWKPSISHRDYVTQIKITAYTYTEGLPHTYDEYVTDGTTYWVVQKQVITLSNNMVPSGTPDNVVEISDVTMVSPTIASIIAQNLVAYYFDRMEVDCEVIDNAAYIPGDLVTIYTDEGSLCRGYIDQVDFTFGVQAKGKMHLTAAASVDGALLTIQYKWGSMNLSKRVYFLPKNYAYSITTEYIDWTMNHHRYIFRPTPATVSGTLTQNTTLTVNVEVALDYYREATTEKSVIDAQERETLGLLNSYYTSMINRADTENIKKVFKLIYEKRCNECINGFSAMRQDVLSIAHVLKIESVDDLNVTETESRKTVDIL